MATHKENMTRILEKAGLNSEQIGYFHAQKITPDVVCHLSLYDFQCLGITDKSDIMKLRMACITFGNTKNNKKGRRFHIPKIAIESLFETGFTVEEASHILCISESTLYRNMRQYNLSKTVFTSIEDGQLDDVVGGMLSEFPRLGEVMLRNVLQEKGLKVQRSRLRESLKRLDEQGIQERKKKRLRRRVYSVIGPNHLWHIDTNHKLIRWHFVIAGGVDGFSRLVTFLACTDNNKAITIFDCFKVGIEDFGTPIRVRSDMGMENSKVADYMVNVRGTNGSMLMGKSTHNQRIERLWRDVFDGVLSYYYDLFYYLEDEGLLDILNEKHLYALHHVYLDKINERLQVWRNAWNNHRIRTVKSTPLRLFSAGMLNNSPTEPITNEDMDEQIQENVVVDIAPDPRPNFLSLDLNLSQQCLSELDKECPKAWISVNNGIEVYSKAKVIMDTF